MKSDMERAGKILKDWKGTSYTFGCDVLDAVGPYARQFGRTGILIVADLGQAWIEEARKRVESSLLENGVRCALINGAKPNAPREDLYRISLQTAKSKAEFIVALGGGSTIDAAKAAAVLNTYSPAEIIEELDAPVSNADGIDPFFGTGLVTRLKEKTGRPPLPVIAVQTASSSGAHLTKYANITDPQSRQKKLVVDEAIVPPAAVFDFDLTLSAPPSLSVDGGLDGLSHIWEVFMSAAGPVQFEKIKAVAEPGMRLIISGLRRIREKSADIEGRTALGLGTDLGGYAIMMGGTSGPHLGSFSLVDILSHGRACALLLPYYTVLFAPVIQNQLRTAGAVFKGQGYVTESLEHLGGRDLALAVARGMIRFLKSLDFPTTLREAGASEADVLRMLAAAKDPALKMKLQNMPTPMEAEKGDVERLMKPVLEAAYKGDFTLIP
jgi:alcohol dehydrogenase class IV